MAKANLSVTIPDGTLFRVSMISDSETKAKKMHLEFSEQLSLASSPELRQVVFSGSFCLSYIIYKVNFQFRSTASR